ncbi:MAG TPA: hypothetical protein VLC79_07320 [Cellvibrio sp.]|nr:hypothetical protein [Cellvibrio sp.]
MQIIISIGLLLWLAANSLEMAGRSFIKDVVELHGSKMVGSSVRVESSLISFMDRKLLLSGLCFPDAENAVLFCASVTAVQFTPDFSPSFRWRGLLPDVLTMNSVEVKDVTVFYDIDTEGDNLQGFGLQLLRDSLNAKARDAKDPLLLQIKELKFSNIKINAGSKKKPGLSRSFGMADVAFSDVGVQENGIAPVEILNRITHTIVDGVMAEADKQGLIAKNSSVVESGVSHRRATAKEDNGNHEGGVGKDFRDLGEGIKDTSKKLWKNTKDFFN